MIADNDVNGTPLLKKGRIASGRNGNSKAIQVVNQRNPCNTRSHEKYLFNSKEKTYIGT